MPTDHPSDANTKGHEASRVHKMMTMAMAMVDASKVDCEPQPRTVRFSSIKCVPCTEGWDVADCLTKVHIPICQVIVKQDKISKG